MELIKIYQGNVISARDLYEFCESKERFSKWFIRMLSYGFTEGKDYTPYQKVHPQNKQALEDYYLTLSCAKEISMLQRSDKGKQARQYFIKAEETLSKLKANKRFEYWDKLQEVRGELLNYLLEKGHTQENFMQIDYEGRKVLFNGEPLPDEVLPNILLTARSFAVEISNEILKKSDETDLDKITNLHKDNHHEIREVLQQKTGKLPENHHPEQDIKKLDK
ncbi:antA/AntB antirepressor family protein [Flexithrix dorotheae]|uniref:antA/AntB antirepressor family protein n=1 Tax=Flexithrix dorotheae TaxID=70993 RepID=UPI00037C66E3|nr:antA/AntB antirepressor family protein [Flexithrix dorotheae]